MKPGPMLSFRHEIVASFIEINLRPGTVATGALASRWQRAFLPHLSKGIDYGHGLGGITGIENLLLVNASSESSRRMAGAY